MTEKTGFAEHPEAKMEELEKLADADMYADKEAFYRQSGQDRRRK
jgi:hypothetical protein